MIECLITFLVLNSQNLKKISLNKDALNIDIEDGILSISGDKHQLDDDNVRYIRKELKHSSFRRSFQLGDLLDTDNISANFEDGVLRIEIPKK